MAVGALAAVVHDVLISVGVYSIFGFEVTPATVVAFLTILGLLALRHHRRVRQGARERQAPRRPRTTYSDIVNLSMNQVLMRSLNTSLAAVLPVLSLLVVGSWMLGAVALQDFALALLVGLITGAYSSIFIATPILAVLKEREPKYRAIRQRLERQGAKAPTAARLARDERAALEASADADSDVELAAGAAATVAVAGNGAGKAEATAAGRPRRPPSRPPASATPPAPARRSAADRI